MAELPTVLLGKPQIKKNCCSIFPSFKTYFVSVSICHLLQLVLSCQYFVSSLSVIICILMELPVSFHFSFITFHLHGQQEKCFHAQNPEQQFATVWLMDP